MATAVRAAGLTAAPPATTAGFTMTAALPTTPTMMSTRRARWLRLQPLLYDERPEHPPDKARTNPSAGCISRTRYHCAIDERRDRPRCSINSRCATPSLVTHPKPKCTLLIRMYRMGATSAQWFGPSLRDYTVMPIGRAATQQTELTDENDRHDRIVRLCSKHR